MSEESVFWSAIGGKPIPESKEQDTSAQERQAYFDEVARQAEAARREIQERLTRYQPPQGAQAGWYQDPAGEAALRWWDGEKWSEHTHSGVEGS